jgi:D-amino-acid dehydrogenase
MRVAVLGGGVIGVTSAYYLAEAGHEVTLLERQPGPALETSFANAGEISPGYAAPWAAPGIPAKAIRWLMMRHAPLILRPQLDVATISWLFSVLGNCTEARYACNKARMVRLAEYSRDLLIDLRAKTGISYDERSRGTLQLFRSARQMGGIAKDVEVLTEAGVPFQVLDAAGCIAVEPGLANARESISGGLRLPNDETGDCYKFTVGVAELLKRMGVAFRFDTTILGLRQEGGRIAAVRTLHEEIPTDAVVAALGSYTPGLLRSMRLRLPIYPVKGYSITAPIVDEARAPVSTLLDETYKVAITRLGDRIRVGGMAEISGFNNALHPRRRATLEHSVEGLFPGAGDVRAASFWSGLRPMTPDGTPIVGPTRIPNLFVNAGHGTLGWTMACGSAQVIADAVSGRPSAIQTNDLAVFRYER